MCVRPGTPKHELKRISGHAVTKYTNIQIQTKTAVTKSLNISLSGLPRNVIPKPLQICEAYPQFCVPFPDTLRTQRDNNKAPPIHSPGPN